VALTVPDAAVRAAVAVAERFGITSTEPAVLADGANVVVHLSPAPVVAKVAASTPAVRPDSAAWLQRELGVTAFLAARGAPVVPPSSELPATTHSGHGHVMSFWRYQPPANLGGPPPRADEETLGSMLRDLHAVLRGYPGPLPVLAPLQDIPAFLARPRTRLAAGQKAALAAAYARLTAELDPAGPAQPLHGDAGAGNLMATGHGWLWHDFEDTCSGPVAWDLAASTASRFSDGPRVLAAYGDPVDAGQLAVCERLRRLHLTVWYCLYAERLPELSARAAELVAGWPPAEAAPASR
jgi:Ser/Thr protein kinase RdoA (MazF antagonist)